MASSLAVSLLHLGSPRRAVHALNNLSNPWLSREIFIGLLFTLFGALFTTAFCLPGTATNFVLFLATMAAASGLAFVYSMGRLYKLRTAPAWNTQLTPLTFFLNALGMGYSANSIIIAASTNPVLRQLFSVSSQIATLWLSLQIITAALFTV